MRKVRAVLVSAVLATGMSLSIGAAPAQAETVKGIYRQYSECQRVGSYGDDQGWWNGWRCEWKSQYYYYFLYA
ncbi:hypothetical protein GCM10009555_095580 [Acrocarpospora macrocephala]|uniref:Uncharacterized protein n=1 Tax=Acrocarpospora macrocephala TaxID=150177 RepID=A0A5M3WJY8_9ACTN|nr:hypothetical protein [Acrocarpospora macrocephala]GES09497.1 hypothetical protein Amac_030930 [Acrocarpospora macrocephala]